jgi:hypothetical protein
MTTNIYTFACVGSSADGARRVFGQGMTAEVASQRALEAANDYLIAQPEFGPIDKWAFRPASKADLFAVQFARDID